MKKPTPSLTAKRSRRSTGLVTLADVAELAGVSTITVSRVLNSPQMVTDATREAVQVAVAQTGYVPNLLAGGLASSKSRLIAAVVPTITGLNFLETIQTLNHALMQAGYQLMLGQTGYDDAAREENLITAIIGRRPDGIFLTGVMHSEASRKRLKQAGIPVIEAWDLTDKPIDRVIGFSHEAVGRAVAQFLRTKGYQNLAIITGDDTRALRRCAGFMAVLKHQAQVVQVAAPTSITAGRVALHQLLQSGQKWDAIFCSSDLLALGVLTEAQANGMRIPHDLAIVGFADLDFAQALNPALTTVRIDGTRIGTLAAEYFVRGTIAGKKTTKVVDLGFSMIQRAST